MRALSRKAGKELDPLRFRGNLYLDGLPAWREFAWVGRRVRIGAEVELEILRPIERCKATSIDPTSARADLNLPALLAGGEGHIYCGVYARAARGPVHVGDAITLAEAAGAGGATGRCRASAGAAAGAVAALCAGGRRVRESAEVDSFWLRDRWRACARLPCRASICASACRRRTRGRTGVPTPSRRSRTGCCA